MIKRKYLLRAMHKSHSQLGLQREAIFSIHRLVAVLVCGALLANGTAFGQYGMTVGNLINVRSIINYVRARRADARWGYSFTAWAEYNAPFRTFDGAFNQARYTPTEFYPVEQDAQYRLGNQPPYSAELGPVPFTFQGGIVEMDEGGNGVGGACDTRFNVLYAYTGWAHDIIRLPDAQPRASGPVSYQHAWLKGYLTRHVVEVTTNPTTECEGRISFQDYVYRYQYHSPSGAVTHFYQRPGETATRSRWTTGPCNQRTQVIPPEPTSYWSDNGSAMLDTSDGAYRVRWSDGSVEEFHRPETVEFPLSVITTGAPRWYDLPAGDPLSELKIRDRNGNIRRYKFTATTESMIDTRERETKVTFDFSPNTPGFRRLLSVEVPAPGAGTPLKYQVTWKTPFSIDFSTVWSDVKCHGANGSEVPCGTSIIDLVDSIKVPDGRSYVFVYTPWGSLDTVTEPDGAVRKYNYGGTSNTTYATNTLPLVNRLQRTIQCGELWSGEMKKVQARGVTSEEVFPLGTGAVEKTSISYERTTLDSCINDVDTLGAAKGGPDACTQVWKVITYPDLSKQRIGTATRALNFYVNRPPSSSGDVSPHGWEIGNEVLNAAGTLISSSYSGNKDTGEIYHEFEIIPTIRMNAKAIGDRRSTKVKNSKDGVLSAVTYAYGDVIDIDPAQLTTTNRNTANITRKCVWSGNAEDCDNSDTGTKLVETITSYHHPAEYLSRNLLHLPSRETLFDPQHSGIALKRTDYTYDQGTLATSGAPPSVLDTSVSSARGNVTTVTSYRNAVDGSGGVSATNTYFDTGQIKESRDANTNPTTMEYDFGLCSPAHSVITSRVRNAKSHTITTVSDCWSGLTLRVTDPNNQSTYSQYDHLGRLVEVAGPGDPLTTLPPVLAGSAPPEGELRYLRDPAIPNDRVKNGTLVGNNGNGPTSWIDYLDLGNVNPLRQRVVTHTKDGTQNGLYVKTFTDGLGRTRQTRKKADPLKSGGAEIIETFIYDTMGRVREAYVPYGVTTAADAYEAPPTGSKFTLTEYDALGRVTGVTQPGPIRITTVYEKNAAPSTNEYLVTVTDSKTNKTRTFMDVLGRTLLVARSAPAATCSSGWCVRIMDYDAAGRLLRVLEGDGSEQIEQMTFIYDDLGRKKEMTDKDMGTWKYTYDNNGNLMRQIDGRGQIVEMKYDVLNRLVRKDLPPNSQSVGPEDTLYFYDGDQP